MTTLAYIGTQGEGPGQGILAISVDEATGALTDLGVVAEEERPTFVLSDPVRPVLYAVSEVGNRDDRCGAIMSYRIADGSGRLQPLGRRRTGGGPTHLDLDQAGGMLYCANFGGPQAVALPVAADGNLQAISAVMTTTGTGPHKRQTKPHPHGVTLDPTGRFLLVPDMGADRIFIYRVAGADLVEVGQSAFPAGCGPRFVLFGADGGNAYMLAELSAEIYHLSWSAESGTLTQMARIPMDAPGAQHAPGAAAFGRSADGRTLYVSNRGSHEMQVYEIAQGEGTLTQLQRLPAGGERPWGLGVSHSGRWMVVANQASNRLSVFEVSAETGLLTSTGQGMDVLMPTSVSFVAPRVLSEIG